MASLGYSLTLLYIVLLVGRVPEITSFFIGNSLFQVLVVTMALLALAIISGVIVKVGSTRIGLYFLGFHLWVMLTMPMSGYRRGSFDMFGYMMKYLPAIFFVGGFLIRSTDTMRRGLWALAWAGTVGLLWSLYTGGGGEDVERFASFGTFSNSNELAIYLLLMLPAWGFIVVNTRYNWFTRIFFMAVSVAGLMTSLRTGSRSGLMTIGLLAAVVFLSLSIANKFKFIVVAGIATIGILAWTPDSIKSRWVTILNNKANVTDDATSSAVGSSEARWALLIESLETTIHHPIMGTGIGVYTDVAAREKNQNGQRALWQVTHNAYTQISAETGIPGFILYMTALCLSIKELLKVRRLAKTNPQLAELGTISTALLYCYLVFCFNGCFTSMAMQFTYYTLVGFSIAMTLASQQYLTQTASSNPAAAPLGSPRFFPRVAPAVAGAKPAVDGLVVSAKNIPDAAVTRAKDKYENAPWRRNPRKHPPKPGTPSR